MKPAAKEFMKKQFDKRGGLLNYLRRTGKYGEKNQNFLRYVNTWWETTARLNEMRYLEWLGLDPRKGKGYKSLREIYDKDFIKEIYKYSWAGIPIADAANLGEPDEHLNRLEKIE